MQTDFGNNRLKFTCDTVCEKRATRACTFTTLHNTVQTAVFMSVASFESMRTQILGTVQNIRFTVLLANTYLPFSTMRVSFLQNISAGSIPDTSCLIRILD